MQCKMIDYLSTLLLRPNVENQKNTHKTGQPRGVNPGAWGSWPPDFGQGDRDGRWGGGRGQVVNYYNISYHVLEVFSTVAGGSWMGRELLGPIYLIMHSRYFRKWWLL